MADIQLEIEGEGAVIATEALLHIDGISGNYTLEGEVSKESVMATIATIVAITTGSLTIAEKMHQWHRKYRQNSTGAAIEKVVLVSRKGDRVLLEGATVEQIKQLL